MQVNSVSFKGLWKQPEKLNLIGRDKSCKPRTGNIYTGTYVYMPFKDESKAQIDKAVKKFTDSTVAYLDKRDDDAWGPTAYYMPKVKVGPKLNITSAEYKKISKLDTSIFQNDLDSQYTILSSKDSDKLAQYIK